MMVYWLGLSSIIVYIVYNLLITLVDIIPKYGSFIAANTIMALLYFTGISLQSHWSTWKMSKTFGLSKNVSIVRSIEMSGRVQLGSVETNTQNSRNAALSVSSASGVTLRGVLQDEIGFASFVKHSLKGMVPPSFPKKHK